jgi:hypothetical protein
MRFSHVIALLHRGRVSTVQLTGVIGIFNRPNVGKVADVTSK